MRGTTITTLLILTLTSQVTQATVNLKDASLHKSWIDFDGSEVKTSHLIARAYNSRSLSAGRFGFGWCSNLDVDLTVRSETSIEIEACVERQDFTAPESRKNRPTGHDLWKNRKDVLRRIRCRSSQECEGGAIYVLQRSNGEKLKFNLQGKLLEVQTSQAHFKLIYVFGSLVALSDRADRLLHILSDSTSGRILQIRYGNRVKLDYAYRDTDLIEVKARNQLFSKMTYDQEHNLTRLEYSNHSTEQFTYDLATDRLTGTIRRDGCREIYNYTIKNSENFVSAAYEACGTRQRLMSQIEFFFQTNSNGDSYLQKTRTIASGKNFETLYNCQAEEGCNPQKQSDAGGLE